MIGGAIIEGSKKPRRYARLAARLAVASQLSLLVTHYFTTGTTGLYAWQPCGPCTFLTSGTCTLGGLAVPVVSFHSFSLQLSSFSPSPAVTLPNEKGIISDLQYLSHKGKANLSHDGLNPSIRSLLVGEQLNGW